MDPYGHHHRRDRHRLLAALTDGTPCRRCGHPMIHPDRCPAGPCFNCQLDRGHGQPLALGGTGEDAALEHAPCNRSDGARLGNTLRRHRRPQTGPPEW